MENDQAKPISFTATQARLIKARVLSYYSATNAEYSLSWKELSTNIFELTGRLFKGDSLLAMVLGQISRGQPRSSGPKNLEALVEFLTRPEVKALELKELQEPEVPYLFAMQLLDFLCLDEDSEPIQPPPTLEGVYRALFNSEDGFADIKLEIAFSKDRRLVHLLESSSTYRGIKIDPAVLPENERQRRLWRQRDFKGWGVFTPEENVIGFVKRMSGYGSNQYYNLVASTPALEAEVQSLALHVNDYPFVQTLQRRPRPMV